MSEHQTSTVDTQTVVPFSPAEMREFDADDVKAGAAIGKMLSLFFLYTVIAMTISTLATYWWITTSKVH